MDDSTPTVYVEDEILRQGFTRIPNFILRHKALTPGAKLAYMVLLSYAWQAGSCFPGQARMADDMGVSERSLRTYLSQLETNGFISTTQRGLNQTNVYTIHRFRTGPEISAGQERQIMTGQDRQPLPTKKTQVKRNGDQVNDPHAAYRQWEHGTGAIEEV